MKRLMLFVAIASAILMTAGQVDADRYMHRRGRRHYNDGVLSMSFFFGRPARVYHQPQVYWHPRCRPPRPRPCYRPCPPPPPRPCYRPCPPPPPCPRPPPLPLRPLLAWPPPLLLPTWGWDGLLPWPQGPCPLPDL